MTPEDLRRRRLALGLSQTALGRLLGKPQNTISRWELGMTIDAPLMLDLALKWIEHEHHKRSPGDRNSGRSDATAVSILTRR